MSTTVDERVVSMQFDNRNFESNVSTTMSTLDKLKQKLNLSGASKGLAEVESAARSCNLSPLCSAAETVSVKFDAMSIMAKRALENIVDSAYSAGKRIVSALTIDPVKSGFQEYETQINSVQTILANTESKGSTLKDVNAALDELNKYADQTIYNFTEMTRNIGMFTAAGVDLDTSVNAIKGIANLAAVSGSTSQQASTAMYQLSQALASGTVKLMDWNSVVNAGMGGEVFQNALKETARVHGIAIDSMIEEQGSFRETLSKGWLTSEILTETLQKFTLTTEGLSEAEIEANREMLRAKGYTEDQIEEIFKLGNTATNAATKVKTLTQMWDVLKEAAQSGWSQTWRTVFGDFEEAKALFTPLTDFFTGVIQKTSDWRNSILEFALAFSEPWNKIKEKLSGVNDLVSGVTSAVTEVTDVLSVFQDVVNKVWRGDYNNWGDNPDRRDLLTAAGYDYRVVQDLVNKGYQYKLTMEDVDEACKKYGYTLESNSESTKEAEAAITDLTDAQLKELGLTEEEISMYRALQEEADRLGISVTALADRMSKNEGRTLLIDSLKNIGKAIIDVVNIAKTAWGEIFDVPSVGELAIKLYFLIDRFHKFTAKLRLTGENGEFVNSTGEKLVRTFKGLFAVFDVIKTITGGGLKLAFEILKAVLETFDMDVLDLTANIGDSLVAFRDWFDSIVDIKGIVQAVVPYFSLAASAVSDLIERVKNSKIFSDFVDEIKSIIYAIGDWIEGLKTAKNLPKYIADGIGRALGNIVNYVGKIISAIVGLFTGGIGEISDGAFAFIGSIGKSIVEFFETLVDSFGEAVGIDLSWFGDLGQYIRDLGTAISNTDGFKNFMKIISDAIQSVKDWFASLRESDSLGEDIIAGLVRGLISGIGTAISAIVSLAQALWNGFCSFFGIASPSTLMIAAGGFIIAGLVIGLLSNMGAIDSTLGEIGNAIYGYFEDINWSEAIERSFNGIKSAAKSIASKFTEAFDGASVGQMIIAALGAGIVASLYKMSKGIGSFESVGKGVGSVLKSLSDVIGGLSKSLKGFSFKMKADGIMKIAISIGILVTAVLAIVHFTKDVEIVQVWNAVGIIAAISALLIGLTVAMNMLNKSNLSIGKAGVKVNNITSGLASIGIAILAVSYAVKMLGGLTYEQLEQGLNTLIKIVAGIGLLIAAMGLLSAGGLGKNASQLGSSIFKMSIAVVTIVGVIKLISSITDDEVDRGVTVIAKIGLLFIEMAAANRLAGGNAKKFGGALIKIAIAMAAIIGIIKLISYVTDEEIERGVSLIQRFALIFVAMAAANRLAGEHSKFGNVLLKMSASLLIMVGIVKLISTISEEEMSRGLKTMQSFVFILLELTVISSLVGQIAPGFSKTILTLSISIVLLAATAVALSYIPEEVDLRKGIGAIAVLGLVMAAMIAAAKNAQGAMGAIIAIDVALALIIGALIGISFIPAEKLKASATALTSVMAAFALMLLAAGTLDSPSKGAIGTMAVMIIAVGAIGAVFAVLSELHVDDTLEAAESISLVLLALAASFTIMSLSKGKFSASIGSIGAMLIAVAGIAAILAILDKLDVAPSIETALSLSILLLAFSGAVAILSLVGPAASGAMPGIGALGILIIAVGALLMAIGNLVTQFPQCEEFLNKGIPILEKIGSAIGSFFGNIVGGFVDGFTDGLADVGTNLSDFMDNLGGFISGAQEIGKDDTLLNGVTDLVAAMALISGANIIDSVSSFITDLFTIGEEQTGMEKFATDLQTFGDAMVSFSDTVSGNVDVEAMGPIAEVMGKLTELQSSVDPIGGLICLFTGRDDLGTFGENIGQFFQSMVIAMGNLNKPAAQNMNTEAVASIISVCEDLVGLQSTIEPIGGLISLINGRDDLGTFGENLGQFFQSMVIAMGNLNKVSAKNMNIAAVDSIISVCEDLVDLQSTLEPIGGVITWFKGRDDLGTFGENIGEFFQSMIVAMGKLNKVSAENMNVEAIDIIITAAQKLADFQSTLEPIGGVISWFNGRDDLGTFGEKIGMFADAMCKLKEGMGDEGISESVVTSVTNAGNAMIALQNALPEDKWFDGKLDLDDFGNKISKFGDGLSEYSDKVSEIDFAATGSSITVAKRLSTLAQSVTGIDTDAIDDFEDVKKIGKALGKYSEEVKDVDLGSVSSSASAASTLKTILVGLNSIDPDAISNFNISSLGTKLKDYSDKVTDMDISAVTSSVSCANRLITLINSTSGIDTSGINTFKGAIESLANTNFSGFTETFNSSAEQFTSVGSTIINTISKGITSKQNSIKTAATSTITSVLNAFKSRQSAFASIGSALIINFASGMSKQRSSASSAARAIATSAASSTRSSYSSFYSAGSYLAIGFANGIRASSFRAAIQARAMARAAYQAAKNELDINSPSKVFRRLGTFVPEGFAQGIDKLSGMVKNSAVSMAGTAINGTRKAISNIVDVIDSGVDTQPSIRPVLDLSDVKSGVGAIGDMFSITPSVGVLANVGAISYGMNSRQNVASNDDVVSAISTLGRKLGNITGDTYNINGISYDDGTNVSDAIRTLVRAARIERRV